MPVPLPSGLVEHVYVATDETTMVVALRKPDVDGQGKSETVGTVTHTHTVPYRALTSSDPDVYEMKSSTVSLDGPSSLEAQFIGVGGTTLAFVLGAILCVVTPWLGIPVGAVIAIGSWVWSSVLGSVADDQWAKGHRVLSALEDKHELNTARFASERIIRLWPRLAGVIDAAPYPGPALAQALWDLSGALATRQSVRATRDELRRSSAGVPAENKLHGDIAQRLAQAEASLSDLDADVRRRVGHIESLARAGEQFLREQDAIARAKITVRDADRVLGTVVPQSERPSDVSEELAASTVAVLDAYRELTRDVGADD